jgi:LCP family protein required for cell wall assembly
MFSDIKMNEKTQRFIKRGVLILVALTILLGVGYLVFTWYRPINPPLELEPTADMADNQGGLDSELNGNQTTAAGESLPDPICGGPPTMMVIVTGVASENYLYGLADAIRVARIDFQTQQVSVLALPRDLWVEIPGLESRGITEGKLNQAYFYGTEGMGYYNGSGYGSGLLAESLMNNYGLVSDHYLSVNQDSFREIINTLGGIDVYLPQDVYKRIDDQPVLFLKAGHHHLNGKQAEMLARQRITIGDFGRINNQTIILRATAAKILSPSGLTTIPTLVEQLKSNVQTDFSPAEISQLICLAGRLDFQEDLQFTTLPEDYLVEKMVYDPVRDLNTAALLGDHDKIRALMEDFMAGMWP